MQEISKCFLHPCQIPEKIPAHIEIEASRSGASTILINKKYIHSKYDPEREASQIIHSPQNQQASAAILLGMGLGYLAKEWITSFPDRPLLIIEQEPAFLLATEKEKILHNCSLDRTQIACHPDKNSFISFFKTLSPFQLKKITIIKTTGATNNAPEFYQAAEKNFSLSLKEHLTNLFTELEFERIWFRNILLNAPTAAHCHHFIELRNTFNSQNAILIGAGPTLKEQIPFLQKANKHAILFAVDTALQPLQEASITPDFVISLDSQIHNYFDFNGCDTSQISLICDITTYPLIAQRKFKDIFFFETAEFREDAGQLLLLSHPTTLWIKQCLGELGPVRSGGNVATSALEIIRLTGIKHIIFAGCDNGFPYFMYHAPDTPSHKKIMQKSNRTITPEAISWQTIRSRFLCQQIDYSGTPLLSDIILQKYAEWTASAKEEAGPEVQWHTLSSKSLPIAGIPAISPTEAMQKIAHSKKELPVRFSPKSEHYRKKLKTRLIELQNSISELLKKTNKKQKENNKKIETFFTQFPFMRKAYSAQLLHAETKTDQQNRADFLLGEIRFQLKQTAKQIKKSLNKLP